jgi:hypothetical protein
VKSIPLRPTIVWLGLVLATVVTTAGIVAAIAIAIGFGKAAFIGLEFMELRHAPPGLRYAFLAWCAAVGSGCLLLRVL